MNVKNQQGFSLAELLATMGAESQSQPVPGGVTTFQDGVRRDCVNCRVAAHGTIPVVPHPACEVLSGGIDAAGPGGLREDS